MSNAFTATAYMGKAQRAIEGARVLLGAGDTEGACSRAYYAMFDAAHAALIASGHETPTALIKKHHTLIADFGKKLVLGGQMDAVFGRTLNKIQEMRLLADYSCDPPSVENAKQAVEQAEAFVATVRVKFFSAPSKPDE